MTDLLLATFHRFPAVFSVCLVVLAILLVKWAFELFGVNFWSNQK